LFCVGEAAFNLFAFYKCSKGYMKKFMGGFLKIFWLFIAQQNNVKTMMDNAKNKAQNYAMNNIFKSIKLPMNMEIKV
jgi:hypothetical protein